MRPHHIFIIAMLLLSGCAQDEIRIGYIGALTGEVASAGIPNMRGVELAVDEINRGGGIDGRTLRLSVEDDQLTDRLAIAAYHKFRDSGADAILSMSYGSLLALAGQIDSDRQVVVESLDVSDEIANAGEYLFGVGIWDEGLGIALADFTYENLQEDEVAFVFNNDDPITTLIKDAYKDRFLEHGGKIILEEGYSFTNMDFRTIAIKLQNADADTVVVIGFDESGLLLKQAEELGLDITFLGWDQFNTQGFKRNAGDAAAGAYFTFWAPPDAQRYEVFRAKYEAKYDEELIAPTLAATGYDAMMVVAEALRISVREEVTLKDAMHMVENHEGVTGTLTMEDDGVVRAIREDIFRFDEHLEPVPAS